MNKTNDYKIHPYCFISALPDTKVLMSLVNCTQQANEVEVHNDDGFIYSEYKHDGSNGLLKVGYRLPEVISPASADTFLAEVLVEDAAGRTYGSIVGGTILSPTDIKPAIHIQCGDRAHGGNPRIVEAIRAGLTYTTDATMKRYLNPEMKHVVHIAGPEGSLPWISLRPDSSSSVRMDIDTANELCDDPSVRAGTVSSYFDIKTCMLELKEVSNIRQG